MVLSYLWLKPKDLKMMIPNKKYIADHFHKNNIVYH